MKRTLRGIVCDTKTATQIGVRHVGEFGQADGYEEQLFVTNTRTKHHFIYGIGGPESPYKSPKIKLLTNDKVEEWKNLT